MAQENIFQHGTYQPGLLFTTVRVAYGTTYVFVIGGDDGRRELFLALTTIYAMAIHQYGPELNERIRTFEINHMISLAMG